jgi:Coenzyme PQQ synthesis protein D (PqqD)
MMPTSALSHYLCNPDVVLREEDEDGGLLFNPDTNQIRVLNHTGLFIWKLCDGSRGLTNILEALREAYEEVPEEQVDHQVKNFIDEMVANGFIGIQASEGAEI